MIFYVIFGVSFLPKKLFLGRFLSKKNHGLGGFPQPHNSGDSPLEICLRMIWMCLPSSIIFNITLIFAIIGTVCVILWCLVFGFLSISAPTSIPSIPTTIVRQSNSIGRQAYQCETQDFRATTWGGQQACRAEWWWVQPRAGGSIFVALYRPDRALSERARKTGGRCCLLTTYHSRRQLTPLQINKKIMYALH